MAHVVELFGAPGTGKSSLAHALTGRRVEGRRIIGAEQLTRISRGGLLGRLRPRDLAPGERRAALAARRNDWAELIGLIAASPIGRDLPPVSGAPAGSSAPADPLRVLHAPGWVADSLLLRSLAETAPDDVIVVLDEGLVQRAPIVCGHDPDDATLVRYLGLLPKATLHVHLTADPAMLLARLRDRSRVIDRHAGLDDVALGAEIAADRDRFARIAMLLEQVGAPVQGPTLDGHSGDTDDGGLVGAVIGRIVQALG